MKLRLCPIFLLSLLGICFVFIFYIKALTLTNEKTHTSLSKVALELQRQLEHLRAEAAYVSSPQQLKVKQSQQLAVKKVYLAPTDPSRVCSSKDFFKG
jgi:hypothetical protein